MPTWDTPEPKVVGTYRVIAREGGKTHADDYKAAVRIQGPSPGHRWYADALISADDAASILAELGPPQEEAEQRLLGALYSVLIDNADDAVRRGTLPRRDTVDLMDDNAYARVARRAAGPALPVPEPDSEVRSYVVTPAEVRRLAG